MTTVSCFSVPVRLGRVFVIDMKNALAWMKQASGFSPVEFWRFVVLSCGFVDSCPDGIL